MCHASIALKYGRSRLYSHVSIMSMVMRGAMSGTSSRPSPFKIWHFQLGMRPRRGSAEEGMTIVTFCNYFVQLRIAPQNPKTPNSLSQIQSRNYLKSMKNILTKIG
jgi:hypothetical protein